MTGTVRVGETPTCRGRCHQGARRPPSVAAGRQLCAGCHDRAEDDLVELSELCTFRDHHPVVTIQSDVVGTLASWCGVVAGERDAATPDELCVCRLTSFLAFHLDWLTGLSSATAFADELDELASVVREALPAASGPIPQSAGIRTDLC